MTYWLLAAALSLSTLAVVTAVLAVAVGAATPAVLRRTRGLAPEPRARALFWVRLAPALGGAAAAFALVLPVFLISEPADTREAIGLTLMALAVCGAAIVLRAGVRALAGWRATRAVRRAWCEAGEPLAHPHAGMPAIVVDAPFPIVAVIGSWRPLLVVARGVLGVCPEREVRAMIEHERAHVDARDNLRRLLVVVCPGLAPRAMQARIEAAWAEAAEAAADARAARGRDGRGLDLADALVRLARLGSHATSPIPASAFYGGGSVEPRVRRLIDPPVEAAGLSGPARAALLGALTGSAGLLAWALPSLFPLLEAAVTHLP